MAANDQSETIKASVLPWQQGVVKQLLSLKNQDKLPHAILIENRSAADATSVGWYMVQVLLCETASNPEPCGTCKSCRLIQSNNYPDFTYTTVVEDEKSHKLNKFIKIDQIRKLIHQISLTENSGNGKFALIYPAERMQISASNSLLKTLEEPPGGSTLILISHNPGKLPVTISSRCQKWIIDRPDTEQAEKWLVEQGVQREEIAEYLSVTNNDAEQALHFYQNNYHRYQAQISELFPGFLNNQIALSKLVKELESIDLSMMKFILNRELNKLIQAEMQKKAKLKLSKLLDIFKSMENSLNIDQNNLNLRLQLEDMLISMKQIFIRG